MSTNEEIINQAKALISKGEAMCASQQQNSSQSYKNSDYYLKYHQARRLLLAHGYEKAANPVIQQAYAQLIPDHDIFVQEKKASLDKLADPSLSTRLQAIRYISRKALYLGCPPHEIWLAQPTTVTILIDAMQDESEPKVVKEIIITLGAIYSHYFKDRRIFPELFKFLEATNSDILVAAINWTGFFDEEEKWPKILELLQTKKYQKILEAVCNHIKPENHIPVEIKHKLLSLLIDCRKRKLNENNRFYLLYKIISLVDESTIDHFYTRINFKKDKELSEVLTEYISMNQTPEEHHVPEINLEFIKSEFRQE